LPNQSGILKPRNRLQRPGVVLQENFLFRGPICENIIAGRPGLTLNDAVRAARLAGAEEFIERMPNGYETLIEEGSPNLSGGQRQRLAIARALITDPRILILDEAMSALDPESEAVLNANLLRIAHGRTMIVVSHRLSSLIDCDQILVLENGKAVDIAPHRRHRVDWTDPATPTVWLTLFYRRSARSSDGQRRVHGRRGG